MNFDNYNERKKINKLKEIYDGEKLLIEDFVNLDLSNLDLSIIPLEKWENCFFYNTSFKNTGIKFIPNKLRKISNDEIEKYSVKNLSFFSICMNFCDFSDNDLTYIEDDFSTKVNIYGCDFSNTGINFLKYLTNVALDTLYEKYDFDDEYWKFESGTVNFPDFIDINTIIKNPFLKVPSFRLLNAIAHYMREISIENNKPLEYKYDESGKIIFGISSGDYEYKKNILDQCEKFLNYDKQGYGKMLYNKLKPFMSIDDKFNFFIFKITGLELKNINFESIPIDVLRYYYITNNKFENVVMNYSMIDLLRLWNGGTSFLDVGHGFQNKYESLYLPNINYDSWQDNKIARKHISDSSISFFTKVYLELSRDCNANCVFCRNNTFSKSSYCLDNIKETLYRIKNYVNAVVIGGGEPTLKLDDIMYLHACFPDSKFD